MRTTKPHVQRATCQKCRREATFTWPAGLTEGAHKDVTMCACGQGHDWTLRIRFR
ncbi:hypothetical protein [Nonomuraea sp. SBT364]|uniref:hypothetical protein n=1 Tax=Nonomuraea sp. SBT364 TaxID=1580530 RepID=UPI000A4196F8|nr:hypothetical protein [Nonomuraea sp. SBT364]